MDSSKKNDVHSNSSELRVDADALKYTVPCDKCTGVSNISSNGLCGTNVTVIGIGRLGLGLALLLEAAGHRVVGVDVNADYVQCLNDKTFDSKEPGYTELLQNCKHFTASVDVDEGITHADLVFIMVQTPNAGGERMYDHAVVSTVLQQINDRRVRDKHIIIGCTVMPKYIDEVASFLLSDCLNTTVSYNPEFVAQGEILQGMLTPDIVLIGTHSPQVCAILKDLYAKIVRNAPTFHVMTPREAEVTKIALNGYITTKISFANMISDACDALGADKDRVLHAVGSDSRIGVKCFKSGYSYGGPCFPRDTLALALCLKHCHVKNDLLLAADAYNKIHCDVMCEAMLLEDKDAYVIENVCYKEHSNVPIIEESPKLKIAQKLRCAGKKVTIKDQAHILNEVKKQYGNIFAYIEKKG